MALERTAVAMNAKIVEVFILTERGVSKTNVVCLLNECKELDVEEPVGRRGD